MEKPELTKEIAYDAIQKFFNNKPFVLFGTGTSCAVDTDYGMGALKDHLENEIPRLGLNRRQISEWNGVLKRLNKGRDFESSMDAIVDGTLVRHIIDETAKHVAGVDRKNVTDILNGTKYWPAATLFKRLVERLPETDRTLHVATPNYDLSAEYAFTQAGIPYTTGFWGGVVREHNSGQAKRQMTYVKKIKTGRSKTAKVTRYLKHLCLYKVHGSLNTFSFNGRIVETDAWEIVPNNAERLIVTPGTSKYKNLMDQRDALLSDYDQAVKSHSAFLFLGFGFNDTQLVANAIDDKLKNQLCPGLILTMESNERIQSLLSESKTTWLVCKHEKDDSTMIYNSVYRNALNLTDTALWKFDEFTNKIMGG